ncbi:MAG: hypothetical protein Alis3KO_25850 [Aliiglaciecola sp.]
MANTKNKMNSKNPDINFDAHSKLVVAGYWEDETVLETSNRFNLTAHYLEPDPNKFEKIRANETKKNNAQFHNWTLGKSDSNLPLYSLKPERFNSILKPKNLTKIFRNSKVEEKAPVVVKSLDTCGNELNLKQSKNNILLIGMNVPVGALHNCNQALLGAFSAIRVRVSNPDLYDTEQNITEIEQLIISANFKLVHTLSESLHTELVFERDAMAELMLENEKTVAVKEQKIAELEKKLSDLEKKNFDEKQALERKIDSLCKVSCDFDELTESHRLTSEKLINANKSIKLLTNENETLQSNFDLDKEKSRLEKSQLTLEVSDVKSEIKKALSEKEELSVKLISLEKESVKNLHAIKEELNQAQNTLSKKEAELEDANQKCNDYICILDEEQDRMKLLTSELEEMQKTQNEQAEKLHEKSEYAQKLHAKIKSTEEKLNTAIENELSTAKTLSLNTKLMTSLEMKSNSLQEKIRSKKEENRELKELIIQLHEKLRLASQFYQQVQQNYPELLNNEK